MALPTDENKKNIYNRSKKKYTPAYTVVHYFKRRYVLYK